MKKTFQLAQEGKKPDRLLEATKHEIRKYIKRERRRALPYSSRMSAALAVVAIHRKSAPISLAKSVGPLLITTVVDMPANFSFTAGSLAVAVNSRRRRSTTGAGVPAATA